MSRYDILLNDPRKPSTSPHRRGGQLAALKKLSLQEQMEGKPGSMSQMVRDAVDAYLRKRSTET